MGIFKRTAQSGNIFFALFGAIALVGILGAGVMTFMKGPLATSVKLTRQNTAETQMALGAQVAVMAAANTASGGDCDNDGYVEPLEWRDAGAVPKPTGGGLVPMSIGMTKKDPWGTEYGYCAWDYGTFHAAGCGGATEKRLQGASASGAYPVVALVSAGQDKIFTTTCRSFPAADVNGNGNLLDAVDLPLVSKAAETDDDIIFTYTYDEATGASGGLWSIKSGDPGTAVIGKNIETTGTANLQGGVLLPDSSLITCDATTAGVMARNATGTGIEICDGTGWTAISGGGASDVFNNDNSVACDNTTIGQVRYNTTSQLPEFCNGTQWLPFTINVPGVNLVISPQQNNALNVDGNTNQDTVKCDGTGSYYCGAQATFTVTNQGTATSAALAVSITQNLGGTLTTVTASSSPSMSQVSNSLNFVVKSNTCSGATLAPNASCTVVIEPKASGNTTYSATLNITANNNPIAILQGTSTNFGCYPGRQGGGGIYVGCGVSDPDGTYDLVVMPGGCNGSTINPTCTGGNDTTAVSRQYGMMFNALPNVGYYPTLSWGARQHQNMMAYVSMTSSSLPATQYCDTMVYGGYSDWFLPSNSEWTYVQNAFNSGKISLVYGAFRLSDQSTYNNDNRAALEWVSQAGAPYYRDYQNRTDTQMVRCVRRDGLPLPSATSDVDPDAVGITPSVAFSAGGTATSNTVTVTGILQTISVSMTGGSGMNIVKNGVSTGSSSISGVKLNDTLAFQMNAPAVLGTKSTATINIGTDSYSWWVGYADSSRVAKVFVSSAPAVDANRGGLTGLNSFCSGKAAASSLGLSSSWKAIASNSTTNAFDNIPWNWGTLKTVTNVSVVDGGFADLWDGSLDNPLNINENGTTVTSGSVVTATNSLGARTFSSSNQSTFCSDWTYGSTDQQIRYGNVGSTNAAWTDYGYGYCGYWSSYYVYCIENIDDASDTTPTALTIPYKVQVPTSSRQSSVAVSIGGMSPSASATLSVSATGGNPKFTVNGGAEVSSASVVNGDSVVFRMDSTASGNASYKMTITANGSTTLGYWRVWTGDTTGTVVKRVFVTSSTYSGGLGGVSGADAKCQSSASGAGLGGTWKAIISDKTDETNWAVNRIGYNWSTLRTVDGTDVATAGQLWNTASSPLLYPITKTQTGVVVSSTETFTNTTSTGAAKYTDASTSACTNYTSGTNDWTGVYGLVGQTGVYWIEGYSIPSGGYPCSDGHRLYCIEQ